MTSAYTSFPNQGVRMAPLLILEVTDREGNMLEQHRPEPHEAHPRRHGLRHDEPAPGRHPARHRRRGGDRTACERCTGRSAGKTGTTDDYTDAWFIGFDPDITIGVWVGYDSEEADRRRQHDRRRRRAADLESTS